MGNEKFSIIVPTRNRKELLINLIKTINLEDENLTELIIVDSSDRNIESEIAILNRKIRYLFTEIRSASIQRNLGVKYASSNSKYIFFLDDDVKPDKDYFKSLLSTIKQNGAIGASGIALEPKFYSSAKRSYFKSIFKRLFLLDSKIGGSLLKSAVNIPIQGNLKEGVEIYDAQWLIGCSIWDIDIFTKINFPTNFFGQSLGEDVLFSSKAKQFGKLVVNSKIILQHSMSETERPNKKEHYLMWIRNRFIISKELKLSKFNILYHWANLGMFINILLNTPMKRSESLNSMKGIFLGYKTIWSIDEN
jgi:GT2 family glycosyltransferase